MSNNMNLSESSEVDVYIAMGSNVGDRSAALNMAVVELKLLGSFLTTSFLYETAPMYHTDQRRFLNAVCKLKTRFPVLLLLDKLQEIERRVGRKVSFRNGPRVIDLDIILYGNVSLSTDRLQVPHLRISERVFVLQPLSDIAPADLLISAPGSPRCEVGEALLALSAQARAEIRRVLPIYNHCTKVTKLMYQESPHQRLMGVLNVTPDR